MRLPWPRSATRVAVAAVVLALAGATLALHLRGQRAEADRVLAWRALRGLATAQVVPANATIEEHEAGMVVSAQEVGLYLQADAAKRLPDVTEHVRKAFLAQSVALELMVTAEEGTGCREEDVIRLPEAVRAFPTLEALLPAPAARSEAAFRPAVAELRRIASAEVTATALAIPSYGGGGAVTAPR